LALILLAPETSLGSNVITNPGPNGFVITQEGPLLQGNQAAVAQGDYSGVITEPARLLPVNTGEVQYGVSFFDQRVANILDDPNALLGRAGQPHFFMPIEDAAAISDAAEAARQTGMPPSVVRAYVNGDIPMSMPAPPNTIIEMAMAPNQIQPGGWGTLDDIPDVNFVRNDLAVTPTFKPSVG
jgi:hypothetical protein